MGVAERSRLLAGDVENGYHHSPSNDSSFLSGLKQRLLSFIFGRIWNEETDHRLVGYMRLLNPSSAVSVLIFVIFYVLEFRHSFVWLLCFFLQRVQCLTKNFYFHFQDYIDLIIWKVESLLFVGIQSYNPFLVSFCADQSSELNCIS